MTETTARYVITSEEYSEAHRYLKRKLALNDFGFDAPDARHSLPAQWGDAAALSHWCQRWLSSAQWQQLKAAVRAARHRRRQHSARSGPDLHIRLQREAGWVLTDLARHEGLTRAEFILRHHRQAWLDLPEPQPYVDD
jgi:hypothetical protein